MSFGSKLKTFFKKIGGVLAFVLRGLDKVIPDEAMVAGLELVKEAGERELSKPERRAWVIDQLQRRFGLGENIARWITETAVLKLKTGLEDIIEKGKDIADDDDVPHTKKG